jgi:hypothetical protein
MEQALDLSKNVLDQAKRDLGNSLIKGNFSKSWGTLSMGFLRAI